jgi:hypothetical protein
VHCRYITTGFPHYEEVLRAHTDPILLLTLVLGGSLLGGVSGAPEPLR